MRDVQAWRRVALLSLLKVKPNQSAAELSDSFEAICDSEGVPSKYSRDMGSQTVSGILRQMKSGSLVVALDSTRNARAGRDEPRWALADPASVSSEFPPILEYDAPAAPAPAVDRAEHEAFRTTADELAGIVVRHRDELAGVMSRHARELEACIARMATRLEPYRGG